MSVEGERLVPGVQRVKHPAAESLARALFAAEMGHTGMTWDQLDAEFGQREWLTKVERMLECCWDPDHPILVVDLANDDLWLEDR